MGAVFWFVLGLLVGVLVSWAVYRLTWQRWRAFQMRDMDYLQAKIKSLQGTNTGLERQLNLHKTEQAGLGQKVNDLERDNRQAQARIGEMQAEKQAISAHLETLRAELAAQQRIASEPALPAPAAHSNGKTHAPERSLPPVPWKPDPNGAARASFLPPEPFIEPEMHIARPHISGDRLEIIPGIGPAILKKLHQAGVDSFLALGNLSPEGLREILGARSAKLMDIEAVIHKARELARESHRP